MPVVKSNQHRLVGPQTAIILPMSQAIEFSDALSLKCEADCFCFPHGRLGGALWLEGLPMAAPPECAVYLLNASPLYGFVRGCLSMAHVVLVLVGVNLMLFGAMGRTSEAVRKRPHFVQCGLLAPRAP